jgi:chromosome segregation protein
MLSEELERQHPDVEEIRSVLAEEIGGAIGTEEEAFSELLRLSNEGPARPGSTLDGYIQTAQESLLRLRKRLEREGEVDPQSIELYEQEDARLRTMQEQFADLEEAKKILETTIRRLKEISRQRFLETFTAVNKKFQELIPRLFGGGAGHLELLNPEDPLTSGVELMVRPPGKRLGSMELMSGGEKALVALSVLISMFLHRPSPICVLDEVDAPLDEANLERYLALITEISRSTQFLVITHNKRTMAEADRLVGITMQEKGVSTALTVALEEAPMLLEPPAFMQSPAM